MGPYFSSRRKPRVILRLGYHVLELLHMHNYHSLGELTVSSSVVFPQSLNLDPKIHEQISILVKKLYTRVGISGCPTYPHI